MTGQDGVGKKNMNGQRKTKTKTQPRETHCVVVVVDGMMVLTADAAPSGVPVQHTLSLPRLRPMLWRLLYVSPIHVPTHPCPYPEDPET